MRIPTPLVLAVALCGCPVIMNGMVEDRVIADSEDPEGASAGECGDEADNDLDGLYDCDDPDCFASPACQECMSGVDCDDSGMPDTGGPDTGDTDLCEVEIRQTYPAADSVDFYHRDLVEFHLNKADETAVLSMQGVAGLSSRNDRNDVVTFAPNTPLNPSTSYTVRLDYCTGRAEMSFTTSDLGGSVPASVLEGKTYAFDSASGRMVEPEGVGAVLQEYLESGILVSPVEVSGGQVQMLSAAPTQDDSNQQDFCRSTRVSAADYSAAPFFEVGPVDLTFPMSGYEIDVEDHFFAGTFAPDGSYIGGITLAGILDTRPLVPLLFEGEDDPNAMCDFLVGFGVSCEACGGDPAETYCLSYRLIDGVAEEVGASLETVETPCTHAQCAETECDPSGAGCATPPGSKNNWWVLLAPLMLLPRRLRR